MPSSLPPAENPNPSKMEFFRHISAIPVSLQNTESHYLYILLGPDSFSYAVVNPADHTIAACEARPLSVSAHHFNAPALSELRMQFTGTELFGNRFQKVFVGIANTLTTLAPFRLFVPDELPGYFNLLIDNTRQFGYAATTLGWTDTRLIWATEPEVVSILKQYFPASQIGSAIPSWLNTCHRDAPAIGFVVFLNVRNGIVHTAVFDRKNLMMSTANPFRTQEEFLYFALLPYEQFRLNPATIPCNLSGFVDLESPLFQLLNRYVVEINLLETPFSGILTTPGISHVFSDLWALIQAPASNFTV